METKISAASCSHSSFEEGLAELREVAVESEHWGKGEKVD
jgi:hypothetical protein